MFRTVPKAKPKWHQLRWRIANWLINLAYWVKPDNPGQQAWLADMLMDSMVYGQHIVRIDPFSEVAQDDNNKGDKNG